MSQAEALLANVTVDDMVMLSSQYVEVEPHIVISIDRFITVPDELKRIAVQHDHNMRTVTFDCPRYYDGRDMATMKVYINYINLNDKAVKGSYIAENVVVDNHDSTVMHFDWTIKSPVTPAKGNLAILVCIRQVDTEGNESNHWNSELNTECYISEGMEFDSETIENEYPDIVTQLLERMDSVEALATPEAMQGYANAWLEEHHDEVLAELQAKGEEVLATIPADYTETSNLAAEASANSRTKADAITRTVGGSAIAVNDSSDDYLRGLRVLGKTEQVQTTGKNLLNVKENLTFTALHIVNTSIPAGTYLLTWSNRTYGGNNKPVVRFADNGILVDLNGESGNSAVTFTKVETTVYIYSNGYSYDDSQNVNATITKLMLSVDGGAYEPYSGGVASPNPDYPQELASIENPTVNIYGKNLLRNVAANSTSNGITFTVNADGSVTVNGTATAGAWLNVSGSFKLPKGTYILSGCPKGGVYASTYVLSATPAADYGNSKTFTLEEEMSITVNIGVYAGCTVNNLTFYPMLRLASVEDDAYEPYKESQIVPIARTLPGVPVTSGGNYTDENGQQWICDEVDFERGVYVQRIGKVVVDGSANWVNYNYQTMYYGFNIWNLLDERHTRSPGLCNQFSRVGSGGGDTIWVGVDNPNIYAISKEWYDKGLDAWKAHLNEVPLEIIYARVTPIETPITESELAVFKHICTNYHNTTVINSAAAEMELKYNADTEIWINNLVKATSPIKSTTVTLSASKWVDTTYGYSQVVTMNGITANSKVDLQPSPDQLADLTSDAISLTTSNYNGVVTVHAIGSHPSSDMTMQVQITEVIPV